MANFKITAPPFRFVANFGCTAYQKNGWTEAGWFNSTAAPDLAGARGAAALWAAKRLALSPPDTFISRIRVWNTNQVYRGGGLLVPLLSNVGTFVPSGGGTAVALNPDQKLLTHQQKNTEPAQGVTEFIGGVPDTILTADGHINFDGNFTTAWNLYVTWIKDNCRFVKKDVTPPHNVTDYAIDDVQYFALPRRRPVGRPLPVNHALDLRT